jgi:hypothetical protein
MDPFVKVFMAVWFGVFALGAIGGVLAVASGDARLPALIPLAMAAFGIGLVRFGRHLARDEQAFIIHILETL